MTRNDSCYPRYSLAEVNYEAIRENQMKPGVVACLLFGVVFSAAYSADDTLFSFQLPLENTSATITDLSWLNHKPAGVSGPVHVGPDGHEEPRRRR
jgi:hypothetical protein